MIDTVGIIAGWAERLFGNWTARQAVDTRIADKAKLLRRSLAASFEVRPVESEVDSLTTWAAKVLTGFPRTEPAMREIVELRPDATAKMRGAVARARDEFYAVADIINPLFGRNGLSISSDEQRADVQRKLVAALSHMHRCLVLLAWIDGEKN